MYDIWLNMFLAELLTALLNVSKQTRTSEANSFFFTSKRENIAQFKSLPGLEVLLLKDDLMQSIKIFQNLFNFSLYT